MVGMQAKRKKIDLVLEYSKYLKLNIKSDPNRLRQVILNLLSNALKFTQKGYI